MAENTVVRGGGSGGSRALRTPRFQIEARCVEVWAHCERVRSPRHHRATDLQAEGRLIHVHPGVEALKLDL